MRQNAEEIDEADIFGEGQDRGWRSERGRGMNDTELLDWMEEQDGIALVSDDFGHWAVSSCGFQNVPEETPGPVDTYHHFDTEDWFVSVREAILKYKESCDQ